jgi:CubicO group peptidase (beta-lactamase class C family)
MPRAGAVAVVFVVAVLVPGLTLPVDEWPIHGWRTATPESQGLDSGVLADLLDHARSRRLPIHSLLLIRHGQIVLDATFYPYESGTPHDVASVTKSVTSVLVGIALDKGLPEER